MAYASWLTLSKNQGTGSDTVTANAGAHTGRVMRTTQATWTASGCPNVVTTVNQNPKPMFVSFNAATFNVEKNGGSVTIRGTTNAAKLAFDLAQAGTLVLSLPASYSANGATTDVIGAGSSATDGSTAAIVGDPGASAEFAFELIITGISANTSLSQLTKQLTATPYKPDENNPGHYVAGTVATCDIEQSAGDPYLNVTPATITLAADGTESGTFTVSTNCPAWEVS